MFTENYRELVPNDQWFAFTMNGFANSPLSWKKRQHSTVAGGFGGENLTTVMRLPKTIGAITPIREDNMQNENFDFVNDIHAVENNTLPASQPSYISWEVVGGRDEHS